MGRLVPAHPVCFTISGRSRQLVAAARGRNSAFAYFRVMPVTRSIPTEEFSVTIAF